MKYKNITKENLSIPDFGIVKAGETAELPENFNNINFEKVGGKKEKVETLKDNVEEE